MPIGPLQPRVNGSIAPPVAHTTVFKPIPAAVNATVPSNEPLPPSKTLSELRKISKKDARSTWDRLMSGYKDKSDLTTVGSRVC
ncbi:unnamed protein product [Clonostachys byssicola]|uniref:Uncharacterized protein n=1 Tax=Clonostachys byssicola TaxID=160290 RepID=A0A9N9Y418_9HYPO|nr:unnamed protein product [Clonostachys byssicola]